MLCLVYTKHRLERNCYFWRYSSRCSINLLSIKNKMSWAQEENSTTLRFESSATTSDALQKDLELVVDRLNKEQFIQSKEILLAINATNGFITISGYDHQLSDDVGENIIWIWLRNFWEDTSNAYDFDDIVTTTIMQTLRTTIGIQTKNLFKVYLQTEVDDPIWLD